MTKFITLKLSLKEAELLNINLGGQSSRQAEKIHNSYIEVLQKKIKYDDAAIYNIFDRLDDKLEKLKRKK